MMTGVMAPVSVFGRAARSHARGEFWVMVSFMLKDRVYRMLLAVLEGRLLLPSGGAVVLRLVS